MNLTTAADFTAIHTHTYTRTHTLRDENVRQFGARRLRQMVATVASPLHIPHWINDFAVGVAVAVDVDVGHSRFVVKLVLQIFCVHLFGGSNRNKAVGVRGGR